MAVNAGVVEFDSAMLTLATEVTAEASLRAETIQDNAAFTALRDEWSRLLAMSPADSFFLSWEWLHTWWTHLSGERRLAIICLRRGSELVAIAPFASPGRSLFGLPTLEFLGTGRAGSDYLDLIVRRGEEPYAIPRLAKHLVTMGAAVDMKQVRITTSTASRLARELRRSGGLVRATRTQRCPVIDIGGRSFDEYLGSLGSEHRYNFLRKLRKLERNHNLSFERVESEERRREILPILFELHRLRWSERGGSDGLAGPEILKFHEELTRLTLSRGSLRLFVLWLGGLPAATLYGFRHGEVFSFYQSGFDPRYTKLSVGLVAMGLAIRSAIEEGATEFDMLHGEEAYKFHWAKRTRCLGRVLAFPGHPLGRLSWTAAVAFEAVRSRGRRILRGVSAAQPPGRNGGGRAAPVR